MQEEKNNFLVRFWQFLRKDSLASLVVSLILAFIFIKFIFFPGLSLITGSSLPLVIVESCSMYHHEDGFEKTFTSPIYEGLGISLEDTQNWPFQNGFSKGDVMFVTGTDNIEVGDVIIFSAGSRYPIIHRVVSLGDTYATKGDNYKTNSDQLLAEKGIEKSQIMGKAVLKIPAVGWLKLVFFEWSRPINERGLCK